MVKVARRSWERHTPTILAPAGMLGRNRFFLRRQNDHPNQPNTTVIAVPIGVAIFVTVSIALYHSPQVWRLHHDTNFVAVAIYPLP